MSAHLPATSVSVVEARCGPAPTARTSTRAQPSNTGAGRGAGSVRWRTTRKCHNHSVHLAEPNAVAGLVAAVNDNSVAYDLVLLAHVLAAVAALVAVVAAGGFALALRGALRSGRPLTEPVVRYFRPGVNWVGRVLFAVPVLGIVLMAMSGGEWSWSDTWISMGTGAWALVAVIAEAVLWPGERHLQTVVAGRTGGGPDGDPGRTAGEAAACLRTGLVGVGLGAALVAVAVLMVAKP